MNEPCWAGGSNTDAASARDGHAGGVVSFENEVLRVVGAECSGDTKRISTLRPQIANRRGTGSERSPAACAFVNFVLRERSIVPDHTLQIGCGRSHGAVSS